MNKKTISIFVISLFLSLACIFAIIYLVQQPQQKPVNYVYVAVAKQNIPAGTFLQPNMYEYVKIPETDYIRSYITLKQVVAQNGKIQYQDPLNGLEVKENIYAGERIMKERLSDFRADNQILSNMSDYKRMAYTAEGIDNMAGQLREGDRVDFWCRYEIRDKDNIYIVVEKILSNVPVVRAIDSSSNEVKRRNASASAIEVMLKEDEIEKFLLYKDMGKITIVKTINSSPSENTKYVEKKKIISYSDIIKSIENQDKSSQQNKK